LHFLGKYEALRVLRKDIFGVDEGDELLVEVFVLEMGVLLLVRICRCLFVGYNPP